MGFQSYELIAGHGPLRERQKVAFLSGEAVNPTLDYPKLDTATLDQGIRALDGVLTLADMQVEPEVRATVWDSAAYRMAEMYWLRSSEELIRRHRSLSPGVIDLLAGRTQALNEQLYGTPEKTIADAITNEVWAQLDAKELVGQAASIQQELERGTALEIAGERVEIAPLRGYGGERLPPVPDKLLAGLREKLYVNNPDIVGLIHDYWGTVIQKRLDSEKVFTPEDCMRIFTECHRMRDPNNNSGILIEYDHNSVNLAWNSPTMSIKIGTQPRPRPIHTPEQMFGKVGHEYVTHGDRTVSGLGTSMAVLGTGLFTEADPGEMSDYLTFEEGLASMCELAVEHGHYSWEQKDLERYFALALAYEGRDFRQTFETLWRTELLMSARSRVEITEKDIQSARNIAWTTTVRIFRGTPTEMSRQKQNGEPRILTFNKDLAYLKGKLQVIEFWRRYGDDPRMIDLAFKAKFDPLNHRQLAIVQSAYDQLNT